MDILKCPKWKSGKILLKKKKKNEKMKKNNICDCYALKIKNN